MPVRPPPGRAGRVWLADRVEVARRAAELLDRKQQLQRREQRRLAALSERTGEEWSASAREADRWCARALVGGGRDDLRRAGGRVLAAQAELTWTSQAGVTYPATATTLLPPFPPLGGDVALVQAAEAYRRALDAAVQHAAASAALTKVAAELAATSRRLRAIRDRWLPDLQAGLSQLDLRLDETEREEITHLRWTQQRQPSHRRLAHDLPPHPGRRR